MGRVNDDNWLDEALDKAIHSDKTRPDFEAWKARHPDAVQELTSRTPQVQRPLRIRSINMNTLFVKLAAAAVIVIAGIIGIMQLNHPSNMEPIPIEALQAATLTGPLTHTFADGSIVRLADGAQIRTYGQAGKRGFEHLAGAIDVTVAKGLGEFTVTTPYGEVKALGTQFTLDLVDGVTSDTHEPVNLLSVEVTEGKVEVSNAKGKTMLEAKQDTIVEKDAAPYDFNQDEALPARLKERIQAMVSAFAAGDAAAWAANYNLDYVFKLAKGQVDYDPLRFGGSEEDAKRLGRMTADMHSPDELGKAFLHMVNINEPTKVYVRAVTLSDDGRHAQAQCITRRTERSMTITSPQWHYFDNDWWQIDD
jgi:ferric-dicitrate binding protein FerR (iron transport regulator)